MTYMDLSMSLLDNNGKMIENDSIVIVNSENTAV